LQSGITFDNPAAQEANVTVDEFVNAPSFGLQFLGLLRRKIAFVGTNVQVVEQFLERAARLLHEFDLLEEMKTAMTFSDIVRERDCSSANLAA
jgi:hypothetical protein